MLLGLRNEPEHRRKRPRQHPRLAAWKPVERGDPTIKANGRLTATMQKVKQRGAEGLRTGGRTNCVAQRHLFEREEQIGAGFDRTGKARDLSELPRSNEPSKRRLAQMLLPAQMGIPLVGPLPVDVGLIAESLGKMPQEFASRLGNQPV